MTWIPVAPLPITPTRFPDSSTPSRGHRAVWKISPEKSLCPGKMSDIGAESIPQQVTRYWVSIVSPLSVVTVQRLVSSSKTALVIVVPKEMSRRRSSASAT